MIATCWNLCHGKCIFSLKMKNLFIFMFLVLSQVPILNECWSVLHLGMFESLFKGTFFFVFVCRFSPLWRSHKFFPKNLSLFHFMWKHHHVPHFVSVTTPHLSFDECNYMFSISFTIRTCMQSHFPLPFSLISLFASIRMTQLHKMPYV